MSPLNSTLPPSSEAISGLRIHGPAPERSAELWRRRLALEHESENHRWDWLNDGELRNVGVITKWTVTVGLWGLRLRERAWANANAPRLRRLEFTFDNLPAAFDGWRVLHVSDLHFDPEHVGQPPSFAERIRDLLAGVEAELCVITGDFRRADFGPVDHALRGMTMVLEGIHVSHGIYGILGNHDSGALVEPYEAMGITMLMNQHVAFELEGQRLWMAGVDDRHEYRCDDFQRACGEVPRREFLLMLAHSPETLHEAAQWGADLYICGHSHGGQICLPGGWPILHNSRGVSRHYARGVWTYGGMQGFTTNGVGTTCVYARLNCPPEAALITLRRRRA
ncbi:MAG: metallophosphoesterase [Candidatus Hydrogenedentota bacterium]